MLLFTSYRPRFSPSLTCSCDNCTRHGIRTYKNSKITSGESPYTFATNDNCPSCVFPIFDRSRTVTSVSHFSLPVPSVSMALAPFLTSTLRVLGSGPCHGLGLFILRTILPRTPLSVVPYPISSSANVLCKYFVVACGFVKILALDLLSVSHAILSPFPMLQPR